jgi:hypothetical protein
LYITQATSPIISDHLGTNLLAVRKGFNVAREEPSAARGPRVRNFFGEGCLLTQRG